MQHTQLDYRSKIFHEKEPFLLLQELNITPHYFGVYLYEEHYMKGLVTEIEFMMILDKFLVKQNLIIIDQLLHDDYKSDHYSLSESEVEMMLQEFDSVDKLKEWRLEVLSQSIDVKILNKFINCYNLKMT